MSDAGTAHAPSIELCGDLPLAWRPIYPQRVRSPHVLVKMRHGARAEFKRRVHVGRQRDTHSCAVVAAQSFLRAVDIERSLEDLAQEMGTTEDGTRRDKVVDCVGRHVPLTWAIEPPGLALQKLPAFVLTRGMTMPRIVYGKARTSLAPQPAPAPIAACRVAEMESEGPPPCHIILVLGKTKLGRYVVADGFSGRRTWTHRALWRALDVRDQLLTVANYCRLVTAYIRELTAAIGLSTDESRALVASAGGTDWRRLVHIERCLTETWSMLASGGLERPADAALHLRARLDSDGSDLMHPEGGRWAARESDSDPGLLTVYGVWAAWPDAIQQPRLPHRRRVSKERTS